MQVGNVHIKMIDPVHWEAFVEQGFDTCSYATGVLSDCVIVDRIDTKPQFRRRGFATDILRALKWTFKRDVVGFAIEPTEEAQGFWSSWANG